MSALYKVCKRNIEKEKAKGQLSEQFIADMQTKLDLYAAAGKITAEEYEELSSMLTNENEVKTDGDV